jgi:hypothetical protein
MRVMLPVLALVIAGCAVDENTFGAEDRRFVDTMVELRVAAMTAGTDTAQFDELRQKVLQENDVTEEALHAYVAANSSDLDHMAAVWDSISERLADPIPQ